MSACQTCNKLQKKRNRHRMCHIYPSCRISPTRRELASLLYHSPHTLFIYNSFEMHSSASVWRLWSMISHRKINMKTDRRGKKRNAKTKTWTEKKIRRRNYTIIMSNIRIEMVVCCVVVRCGDIVWSMMLICLATFMHSTKN